MKPLYSETEWPTIAAYDIESEDWIDVTLVCHVDEYGNRKDFPSIAKYLDWLFHDFEGDVVFAHAGGHYDHRFVMAEAMDRGWEFRTALSGGSIVIMTISNGKKTIKFGDSYRLMPDSLAKIGKAVKLEKIDLNPSELALKSDAEVLEYCYRDCEIVVKGLQLMRDKTTAVGADFAFTLASMATRYIRRMPGIDWNEFVVKEGRKWVPHPNVKLWDHGGYSAYKGGHTEMYKQGIFKTTLYYYDICSSYPTAMREPLPLYYMGFFLPPKHLKDPLKYIAHCGITRCDVHVPEDIHLSPLPVKHESGRLIFPTGELSERTLGATPTWTNIELQEAVKQGVTILKLHGQWRFQPVPFMRKFVDTFYALRQQAKDEKDEFGSYAYKILLNSAYGKLVETVERVSYLTKGQIPQAEQSGARIETTPTQGVFCAKSEEVGPFRHSAAGAYVTAHARLRLYRKAKEMHDRGATIYYCDTDSLILDREIDETGSKLGDWEQVDTLTELELILPKVYRAVGLKETIYKCKGCPIVRKWEDPSMPAKRWEAFKNFRHTESAEDAEILAKEGVTGFLSDVQAGSLHPRRKSVACKHCAHTGMNAGITCEPCNGTGYKDKPLVRALRSPDKKRIWDGESSRPISYPPPPMV